MAENKCIEITKQVRKISASGTVLEESFCTVKGAKLTEVAKEFNKQWKEMKNE